MTAVTNRQETAMTPDEKQLISGLFDRMRSFGQPQKDPEAEALIRDSVQQIPDAAYMLVQSVLVQEHALQQADQRIRELEAKVNELERQAAEAPAQTGGFLGGLFGGGARPAAPAQRATGGSVPSAGSRLGAGPSGRSGPIGAPTRPLGQQPQGQQAGGGFLQSAMATAAGVAGGMLLANTISSMLGGGSSAQASTASSGNEAAHQPEHNHAQDAAADNSANDADADFQDADYEPDAGDWGGGDWGDFEI
jgi:hypothetical protein